MIKRIFALSLSILLAFIANISFAAVVQNGERSIIVSGETQKSKENTQIGVVIYAPGKSSDDLPEISDDLQNYYTVIAYQGQIIADKNGSYEKTILFLDNFISGTYTLVTNAGTRVKTEEFQYFASREDLYKAISDGNVENLFKYGSVLNIENTSIKDYYNKSYVSEKLQKSITARLKGKTANSFEDFDKILTEQFVLSVVETPDGIANLKEVVKGFADKIGAGANGKDSSYKALMGNRYSSYAELKSAFEKAEKENIGNQSSSSGGGGGGGGGRAPASTVIDDIIYQNGNENVSKETLNFDIFEDISGCPWARDAIVYLAEKGIVSGKAENMFYPDDNITRAEFAKLLVEAFANDAPNSDVSMFTDVEAGSWYAEYIGKIVGAGIAKGCGNNIFGTNDCITRQDMAVMLFNASKYYGLSIETVTDTYFADENTIAAYAKESVRALHSKGIINGFDEYTFGPCEYATRAQAAKLIYGILIL